MKTSHWTVKKLFFYSLVFLLLFFVIMELVFRILFFVQYHKYHTSVYIQGNTLQMADSLTVFRNRPFYLDYHKRFQFNEEGMKSEAADVFMPEKEENDFWVFLFGGSAMEGAGSVKTGEWFNITGQEDHLPSETIAAYLQQRLQEQMPGKKVSVFNAANTSFTIWQSFSRYQALSARYKIDWVISMDGQNDPCVLGNNETTMDYLRNDWKQYPIFKAPLKYIIPITSHSAFVNKIKQEWYDIKNKYQLRQMKEAHYPRRKYWSSLATEPLRFANYNDSIQRAVTSFTNKLLEFDSVLTISNQPHLLLIQPHLSMRDTTIGLNETEKALYHYYCNEASTPQYNTFISRLYASVEQRVDSTKPVFLMKTVHHWNQQVFVDYCHLTRETNQRIADQIAAYILSGGRKKLFR